MGDENAMNEILRQLQEAADAAAESAPGEEMTHVAGVSFVDSVGLSLGGKEETRDISIAAAPAVLTIQGTVFARNRV